VQKYKLQ